MSSGHGVNGRTSLRACHELSTLEHVRASYHWAKRAVPSMDSLSITLYLSLRLKWVGDISENGASQPRGSGSGQQGRPKGERHLLFHMFRSLCAGQSGTIGFGGKGMMNL